MRALFQLSRRLRTEYIIQIFERFRRNESGIL